MGRPVARKVPVAEVIRHDEDHVRSLGRYRIRKQDQEKEEEMLHEMNRRPWTDEKTSKWRSGFRQRHKHRPPRRDLSAGFTQPEPLPQHRDLFRGLGTCPQRERNENEGDKLHGTSPEA